MNATILCVGFHARVSGDAGGPLEGRRVGRKRSVNLRQVNNGNMFVLSTGCQWRFLPKDLPPRSTVYAYFDPWQYEGVMERMHFCLYTL